MQNKKITNVKRRIKKRRINILQRFLRRLFKKYNASSIFICFGVILLCSTLLGWWGFRKNAYKVFAGEEVIGVIKRSKKLSSDDLFQATKTSLETSIGSKIKINEEITLVPAHARKKKFLNESVILEEIKEYITYQVEAYTIYLGEVPMVKVGTKEVAEQIKDEIILDFVNENMNILEKTIEDYLIKSDFISKEDLVSKEIALDKFRAKRTVEEEYVVQSGDSISKIADSFGIKMNDILLKNQNITDPTALKEGQKLILPLLEPIVDVKVVVEEITKEIIPKETEEIESANIVRGNSIILQKGNDGEVQVTEQITYINGKKISSEIISEEEIVKPSNEVIQIGTRDL